MRSQFEINFIEHDSFVTDIYLISTSCQEEAKEEKDLEREVPSVIARFFVTISRVLPSPPFVVWHVVEVLSVFLV
jgi:hypothetical protein